MPPLLAWAFARRLLHEAGWPRKLGLFKGEGFDTTMVDVAFAQANELGAALGAERPSLALQMIAEMYDDRDWEGGDAPDLKVHVEELRKLAWGTAASPQEAAPLPAFAAAGAALTVEQFDRREFRRTMEQPFLNAILWGLEHPDRFEAWFTAEKAEDDSMLPLARKAGLGVDDELPSLSEFVAIGEELVRGYEQFGKESQLSPVPPRLLADAKALGWRV
jgi:hypothetical protein